MNKFDTAFDKAAKAAGIDWAFALSIKDRNVRFNKKTTYPCIWRTASEPTKPLFDAQDRMQKKLSLYFVHVGFSKITIERMNEHLDSLMEKFLLFRNSMRSDGYDVQFTQDPYPAWDATSYDEFGIIFNISVTYHQC